ncbi:hypothetical protein EDD22DRAFT_850128 [Suillus occidentalis]|nr:hypothetical protein EDD22DRAFT_850128 [Suillus occidentalis]
MSSTNLGQNSQVEEKISPSSNSNLADLQLLTPSRILYLHPRACFLRTSPAMSLAYSLKKITGHASHSLKFGSDCFCDAEREFADRPDYYYSQIILLKCLTCSLPDVTQAMHHYFKNGRVWVRVTFTNGSPFMD